MYASRLLSKAQRTEEELKTAFYWITGVSGVICFLIFLSNFSTAALVFFTVIILMLIARVAFKYVASLVGIGVVLVVLIFFTADLFPDSVGRVHTVKSRIETFLSGSEKKTVTGTKQEEYARLAIFEGGVFGKGPGNGEVSNYMEAGYNDFIYAIYIEEYGLVGGIFFVTALYCSAFQRSDYRQAVRPNVPCLYGCRAYFTDDLSGICKYGSFGWCCSRNRTTITVGKHGRFVDVVYSCCLWGYSLGKRR